MMLSRRKFLVGSATAAAAAITPIAVLASDEAATVINPVVSEFLGDVMKVWDKMSERLSFQDIIRTGAHLQLDPSMPEYHSPLNEKYGTSYSYDPKAPGKKLLVLSSVFTTDAHGFTMYYEIVTDPKTFEKKWYTVTLMDYGQETQPTKPTEIQPSIQKVLEYQDELHERQIKEFDHWANVSRAPHSVQYSETMMKHLT